MAVVKKTVSIPEELYKEVKAEGENFSKVVKEALEEYIRKKQKERLLSLHGALKDWEIEDGAKFVDKMRRESLKMQKEREKWMGI